MNNQFNNQGQQNPAFPSIYKPNIQSQQNHGQSFLNSIKNNSVPRTHLQQTSYTTQNSRAIGQVPASLIGNPQPINQKQPLIIGNGQNLQVIQDYKELEVSLQREADKYLDSKSKFQGSASESSLKNLNSSNQQRNSNSSDQRKVPQQTTLNVKSNMLTGFLQTPEKQNNAQANSKESIHQYLLDRANNPEKTQATSNVPLSKQQNLAGLPKLLDAQKNSSSKHNIIEIEDIEDDDLVFMDEKQDPRQGNSSVYRNYVQKLNTGTLSLEQLESNLKAIEKESSITFQQNEIKKKKDAIFQNEKPKYTSSILSDYQPKTYNSNFIKQNSSITQSSYNPQTKTCDKNAEFFSKRTDKKDDYHYDYEDYFNSSQYKQANERNYQKASAKANEKTDYDKLKQKMKEAENLYESKTPNKALQKYEEVLAEKKKQDMFKNRAAKLLNMHHDKDHISLKNTNSKASNYMNLPLSTLAEIRAQKLNEEHFKDIKKIIKSKTHVLNEDKKLKELEQIRQKEELLNKQREEERLRARKENNEFLNDLLGFNDEEQTEKKKESKTTKSMTSNFLGLNLEEGDNKQAKKMNQEEFEAQQNQIQRSREEQQLALQKMYEAEKEAEMKRIRYHNRKSAEELIKPILNLELVKMFSSEDRPPLTEIPLQFENFQHYRDIWIPLFLYETYSQMINQRGDRDKEKQQIEALGLEYKSNFSKKSHFEGYIQKSNQDHNYIYLKLYESTNSVADKNGFFNLKTIDSLKEFDLLFISQEPLPFDEVKKVTNISYLMKMREEQGKMLAIVSKRRKRDQNFLEVKIDASLNEEFICLNVRQLSYLKVNVYFFDSLSTTIREFRTIKSCEFFPTADIILNPQRFLCDKQTQDPFKKFDEKQSRMQAFVYNFRSNFNDSQREALEQVVKMKKEDFLLIQGPPGTGKTHTIQGILGMLISSNVKKILICGPSNAAIDEILIRIVTHKLFGLLNESQLRDKLLRVGSMDYEPLPLVKKYILDEKIREEMGDEERNPNRKTTNLQEKQQYVKEKLQQITTITRIISTDQCEQEKGRLNDLLKLLYNDSEKVLKFMQNKKIKRLETIKLLKENYDKKKEELDKEMPNGQDKFMFNGKNKKKDVERMIINRAQIICTTLSMSVSDKLEIIKQGDIEYLIVDEACQCVELTNLIPFEHEPKKVILVGDQQQLPATTFSDNSDKTFYSRSLFERFLNCGVNKFMLSIQYRMHPSIRQFPSNQFYEGGLKDSESVIQRQQDFSTLPVGLRVLNQTVSNLIFFDLKYGQESVNDTSKSNKDEAQFILTLFQDIIKIILQKASQTDFPANVNSDDQKMKHILGDLRQRVGIISPYKSQVRTLKDYMYPFLKKNGFPIDLIEINTVDAYQGREKDIIIISCVRGSQERQLGFLNDYRRMNVAVTRARHFLWVVGNSTTLNRNKNWNNFVEYSKTLNGGFVRFERKEDWEDVKLVQTLIDSKSNKKNVFPNSKTREKLKSQNSQDKEEGEIQDSPGQIKSQSYQNPNKNKQDKSTNKTVLQRDKISVPQQKPNLRDLLLNDTVTSSNLTQVQKPSPTKIQKPSPTKINQQISPSKKPQQTINSDVQAAKAAKLQELLKQREALQKKLEENKKKKIQEQQSQKQNPQIDNKTNSSDQQKDKDSSNHNEKKRTFSERKDENPSKLNTYQDQNKRMKHN
eukprot:403367086